MSDARNPIRVQCICGRSWNVQASNQMLVCPSCGTRSQITVSGWDTAPSDSGWRSTSSPPSDSGLSPAEQQIMSHLVTAWNLLTQLDDLDSDDRSEARQAVHQLQRILATRAHGRAHPGYWVTPSAPSAPSAPAVDDELRDAAQLLYDESKRMLGTLERFKRQMLLSSGSRERFEHAIVRLGEHLLKLRGY